MNKENNNSGPPCPIVPCYTIIICLVVSDFTQFLWPQYQYHQVGQIRSDRDPVTRFKSETTWRWTRPTAFLCEPTIRWQLWFDGEQLQIMKVVLKSNLDATCSCKNKMVTVTRWPFSGFLHFPDHQGFICLWCDRQWPSVGRWLQWNWNITGQNLPTLIGAISWNFIFQLKSLSNARPPNGLLDIKVSTPCLYISIQGGLMMRGVVQRCPQPPMRFYL